MSTIVDVDAHLFEPFTWLKETDPRLEERIGTLPGIMDAFFGELLAIIPPDQARRYREARGPNFLVAEDGSPVTAEEAQARFETWDLGAKMLRAKGVLDPAERIEVNDEWGIDVQFIHPTFVLGMIHHVRANQPELYADYCEAYNRWVLSVYDGYLDRLLPSVMIDFSDPARAVKEMTRVRTAGVRSFMLPMRPIDGRPPSHPDFDPIWDATVDLGLLPVMHVTASGPYYELDWLNTGRGNDQAVFWRLGLMFTSTVPMLALADLLFSGLFDRHPDLIVLCAEFGLTWLLGFMDKLDDARQAAAAMDLNLAPTDYIRRNVRFSPLPSGDITGNRADPVGWFMETFGSELLWFAGDYPHAEGSARAIEQFHRMLDGKVDRDAQERFFGTGALEVLAKGA
jgi:predicted TIM-barrel fold metal-dependent hydrolase